MASASCAKVKGSDAFGAAPADTLLIDPQRVSLLAEVTNGDYTTPRAQTTTSSWCSVPDQMHFGVVGTIRAATRSYTGGNRLWRE